MMSLASVQAAYHGKPIVGMPIFGDQLDNVAKAVNRGAHPRLQGSEADQAQVVGVLTQPRLEAQDIKEPWIVMSIYASYITEAINSLWTL